MHGVQAVELRGLVRRLRAPGLAGKVTTGHQDRQQGQQSPLLSVEYRHDRAPPSPATKSAARSGPRPAGGMWIVSERSTTTAAVTPNTNWETTNQGQFTRPCSTGLTTPMRP